MADNDIVAELRRHVPSIESSMVRGQILYVLEEIERLRKQSVADYQTTAELEHEIERLRAEKERLDGQFESVIDGYVEKMTALTLDKDRAVSAHREIVEQYETALGLIEAQDSEIERLRAELKSAETAAEAQMEEDNEFVRNEAGWRDARIQKLEALYETALTHVRDVGAENERLRAEIARIQRLKGECANLHDADRTRIKHLTEALQGAAITTKRQEEEIARLRKQSVADYQTTAELEHEIERLITDVNARGESIAKCEEEIERLQAEKEFRLSLPKLKPDLELKEAHARIEKLEAARDKALSHLKAMQKRPTTIGSEDIDDLCAAREVLEGK